MHPKGTDNPRMSAQFFVVLAIFDDQTYNSTVLTPSTNLIYLIKFSHNFEFEFVFVLI